MDQRSGNAFVFDVCSFYGHNEYDTGNWRAPRHRLSNKAYIREYRSRFPVSPPEDDWDARSLLYSLTFNIGNTIYIPGSSQRQVVYDDMTTLCKKFCPTELKHELEKLKKDENNEQQATAGQNFQDHGRGENRSAYGIHGGEQEEEEEEEKEEEEDEEKD